MPRGIALVAGLRSVDFSTYGSAKTLGVEGAEDDVDCIAEILRNQKFGVTCLKTKAATSSAILGAIEEASRLLEAGDFFVFYFSGHGGQSPDEGGDEADGKDETLLAYDKPIIDDELAKRWITFVEGVRILMISDSCNSGSNYWLLPADEVQHARVLTVDPADLKAMLIHMGAARDGEASQGSVHGGAFTLALKAVWSHGAYPRGYADFFTDIAAQVPEQPAVFNAVGPVSAAFLVQKPFSI